MVSKQMAAYLKALPNAMEDLILIIDIDRKSKGDTRLAARWDTRNLYHYRSDDLREILARMLLIACDADADWAYELIDQYADGADQWITAFEEEERDLRIEKMIQDQLEVEKVKELNRIKQNKPKVSE